MTYIINYFLEGSLLGLATGISCAAFCLPVLFGLTSRNINMITPISDVSFFLIGRLISYIAIALFFSFIGIYFNFFDTTKSIIKIIISIILIYWGVKGYLHINKEKNICLTKKYVKSLPFIAGILTGISPCPPFIAGVTRVVSLASPVIGIVYFTGFYLATSIFIIPGLFTFIFKFKKELRIISIFISIIFGIIFLLSGIIEVFI